MSIDACSGSSSPANFRDGFDRNKVQVPDIVGGDKVYVAVGKSVEKTVSLFHWAFRRFIGREICLLHVHQPSPLIPTLLGKLPATQANSDVVCAYRIKERDEMQKLILYYTSLCSRSKVKTSFVTTENDQVGKGIMDLVNEYRVHKLVMGAIPENWIKVKKNSSKSSYAAKNAPSFCQIWFVNKSQLLYIRERAEDYDDLPPLIHQDSNVLRSNSSTSFIAGNTSMMRSLQSNNSSASEYSSSAELDTRFEEESLFKQLKEVNMEAEASQNEAFQEFLKRKRLEAQATEANYKVKDYEAAYAKEVELKKVAEDSLNVAKREYDQILKRKELTSKELHKVMRKIAILDNQIRQANRRCEECTEELKLIQSAIANLTIEKQSVQRQRFDAANWVDNGGIYCTVARLMEFSLLDLETATCGFSESFKIDCESYGCLYFKGEMSNKTVMIKKLNQNNLQAESEFQQEVHVVGKLQHRHILRLIGICHEAYALVYEYMPGNLNTNSYSMNWKNRTRIISEIANAVFFLHNSRPKKLLHGNLKPENIFLDSENSSKLCNFRFSRLVNEETFRCHSFRQHTEPNSNGPFLFTEPEFHRTGNLTVKSDVYSFGMIILWLLTGGRSTGLVNEVKKAVSGSNLCSVLDASAGEWPSFVAKRLADLGLQCCESNSRDRPVVSPVLVKELEQLSLIEDRRVPSFFICPITKEIMHDPQLAADGFTYEGEAMCEWLKSGRETSPMTNVTLSNLELIPNHSIRVAIHDWLCNP